MTDLNVTQLGRVVDAPASPEAAVLERAELPETMAVGLVFTPDDAGFYAHGRGSALA